MAQSCARGTSHDIDGKRRLIFVFYHATAAAANLVGSGADCALRGTSSLHGPRVHGSARTRAELSIARAHSPLIKEQANAVPAPYQLVLPVKYVPSRTSKSVLLSTWICWLSRKVRCPRRVLFLGAIGALALTLCAPRIPSMLGSEFTLGQANPTLSMLHRGLALEAP